MSARSDFLNNPLAVATFWVVPALAITGTGLGNASAGWLTAVWTLSLLVMSTGCFINAARCGRSHCAITGPFFLIMAVLVLLHGRQILRLGSSGWGWLGGTILVGGLVLIIVPDWLWGKYSVARGRRASIRDR